MTTPAERYPALAPAFERVAALYDEHIAVHRAVIGQVGTGTLYPLDFFFAGVLKGSLDTVDAILTLAQAWNAIAAISLVRLHLDTLARLAYVVEAPNGAEVGLGFVRGAKLRDLKDHAGSKLYDRALVDRLAERLPWATTVYDATNAFVHLSSRHVSQTVSAVDDNPAQVSMRMGRGAPDWQERDIAELLASTIDITEEILEYVGAWARYKDERGQRR